LSVVVADREYGSKDNHILVREQQYAFSETIISVIKRLFGGEQITSSRLVRTQNRELSFRCIAYNTHRLTNLTIITWFL
jgi:hypothetical protein